MRTIRKSGEPASLTQHRLVRHASYDNYPDKSVLRQHLCVEQRGLCCYCLARIRPERMKIEHWQSQRTFPDEQLNYRNLLGACLGGEGQPANLQHCDTKKKAGPLARNPADPAHHVETLVRYYADGRIASDNVAWNAELEEILNLNTPFLRNNRKAVLDAFQRTLSRRGELQRPTLETWIEDWNGDSSQEDLRPYCQVVVYWLRKRLARG